jgi:hypothetical protein
MASNSALRSRVIGPPGNGTSFRRGEFGHCCGDAPEHERLDRRPHPIPRARVERLPAWIRTEPPAAVPSGAGALFDAINFRRVAPTGCRGIGAYPLGSLGE